MALPNFLYSQIVFNNTDISMNETSPSFEVKEAKSYTIEVDWSGSSPLGALTLEFSNNGVRYRTVPGSSTALSGNTGSTSWTYSGFGYAFIRVVYTSTSGTGSINGTIGSHR